MSFIIFLFEYFVIGALVHAALSSVYKAESTEAAGIAYEFPYHNRSSWGARKPRDTIVLANPAPYIVIHDSGEPPAIETKGCFNFTQCSQSMRNIQNLHMDNNGWWDIGYNFAVGGDGSVYEGRGWEIQGAHAKYFNTLSIGICFIGINPTPAQINGTLSLIAAGTKMGHVRPDYRLVPHGQVRDTPCPRKKLTKKLKSWLHYSNFPGSTRDLLDIPEIPESVKEEIRREIWPNVTEAM